MAERIFQIKYSPEEGWRMHLRRPRIWDAEYHREEGEIVVHRLPWQRIRFRPFIDVSVESEEALKPTKPREEKGEGKTKIDIE